MVAGAAADGRTVKVVGSGHSFSECALTDGVMVDLGALDKVLDADGELVKVQAGVVLADLSDALARRGRAQENLGDIDKQTLAGAISTATHGTGLTLPNISAQVTALELVTGAGEVLELSRGERPRRAARGARVAGRPGGDQRGHAAHRPGLQAAPRRLASATSRTCSGASRATSATTTTTSSSCSPTRATRARSAQPHRGPGAAARALLTGGLTRCCSATTAPKACSAAPAAFTG